LFEEAFNAGDLDGLMELYEPDAALIAQPGSLANGSEQTRAALQGFLARRVQPVCARSSASVSDGVM
jgi:ketosteroid isomerase-like protein